MSKRRRYTDEYEREAVRWAAKLGNLSAAARDLGISANLLRLWCDDLAGEEVVAPGSISPELELRQLRRELSSPREDRDILKKALALFGQDRERERRARDMDQGPAPVGVSAKLGEARPWSWHEPWAVW